uniref:Uncharacterized protein n=1 Tax=Anguilla anguilla TaxID=7936 RepID=A0A0E9RZ00_ANGAN
MIGLKSRLLEEPVLLDALSRSWADVACHVYYKLTSA